jgi:hypothetical protein
MHLAAQRLAQVRLGARDEPLVPDRHAEQEADRQGDQHSDQRERVIAEIEAEQTVRP